MFRLSVPGRTGVRPVLIPPSLATSTIRHFTPTSPSCAAPPAPKWKPTPKSTTTTSSSSSSTYKKPSTSTTTYRPSSAPTTKHNPTSKPQIKPRRTASNPKADASNLGRLPTDLLFPEEDKRVRELYHEAVERMERFDAEVGRVLTGPVREEDLEVDADRGYLYMSEPAYRTLFNLAFGPTSWSLLPTTPFHTSRSGRTLFRSYILTINNRFISEAVGDWSLATAGGDRDEAERRCAHVAMVRVGKDLGVASELWDPRVVNGIRDRLFEVVVVDGVGGNTRVWRRKAGV